MNLGFIITNRRPKNSPNSGKRRDEPAPIKGKATKSAGKLMATVFWDREGILLEDWLPENTTINSDYYIEELKLLRQKIKTERRGKLSRRVLLQHDNARPHVSKKTIDVIQELGFESLPHPPYSPDLAPSDYWLSGEMKRPLRGKRFDDFKSLKYQVEQWERGPPPPRILRHWDRQASRIQTDGKSA